MNQVCLVIQLHLHQYPIGPTQVEFISILLSSMALTWFTPLLEHQSPLFNDFEMLFEKFNATFGNLDKECTSNIKIRSFYQGSQLTIIYALEFKQLGCDISWGETTFISQFQFGL